MDAEKGSISARLRVLIEFYDLNDNAFAKKIGVTQSVIASMFKRGTEPSAKVINAILDYFPDVSSEWLMRGKEPMLLSQTVDENTERMSSLVDTISTLTSVVKDKDARIKQLEMELSNLKKTQL